MQIKRNINYHKLARYFRDKMADPIKRQLQYERTKQCKLNNELKNDIIKKPVGRPRKYNI